MGLFLFSELRLVQNRYGYKGQEGSKARGQEGKK
jgi:hypothetical protein